MTGTIAITMAGLGNRFAKAGFNCPKYEIIAHGMPLFDWSMRSLDGFRDANWRFHFIARSGLDAEIYIAQRAKVLGLTDVAVTTIAAVTDGQATTALIAAQTAPQDAPFAVYNIDTFVDAAKIPPPQVTGLAGWIPCFPATGDGWSFARTNPDGKVVELREKKRISDNATVGLYWFDRADRYCQLYRKYYGVQGREEKGERYIAPLYNQLIADGGDVRLSMLALDDVGMLGTPAQVTAFADNPPPSAQRLLRATG